MTQQQREAYKAEEQRQAQIMADAINKAIQETAKQFDAPIMNALAGAIVTTEAAMLASIGDPAARKALRKVMDATRPRALAEAMTRDHGKVQIVTIGGVRQ
jgi:hypothetical protein